MVEITEKIMKTSISVMKNMADIDMIPISEFWCMTILQFTVPDWMLFSVGFGFSLL